MNLLMVRSPLPSCGLQRRFGRFTPPPWLLLTLDLTSTGNPVWKGVIQFRPHPPSTASASELKPEPKRLLRPTGSSHRPLNTKRCRLSFGERPLFNAQLY